MCIVVAGWPSAVRIVDTSAATNGWQAQTSCACQLCGGLVNVDLYNIFAERFGGAIMSDDPQSFILWQHSPGGRVVVRLESGFRDVLAALLQEVTSDPQVDVGGTS